MTADSNRDQALGKTNKYLLAVGGALLLQNLRSGPLAYLPVEHAQLCVHLARGLTPRVLNQSLQVGDKVVGGQGHLDLLGRHGSLLRCAARFRLSTQGHPAAGDHPLPETGRFVEG